jgi:hypothetical protein
MYIAHVSTSVTLNQTVFNQMVYQQKQGHRVVALCPDDEWTKPIKYRDIPVIHVPFLWHNAKASLTSALLRTFLVCRKEKFDVVHTHTLLPGIAGRIAARLAGVPCVVHTFHSWQPHLYKSLAFRLVFYATEIAASHFAHAILFQNPDDLRSWSKIPAIPIKKGTLVGNGIDFSIRKGFQTLGEKYEESSVSVMMLSLSLTLPVSSRKKVTFFSCRPSNTSSHKSIGRWSLCW